MYLHIEWHSVSIAENFHPALNIPLVQTFHIQSDKDSYLYRKIDLLNKIRFV